MFDEEMLYSILKKLFASSVRQNKDDLAFSAEESEMMLQIISAHMLTRGNCTDYKDVIAYLRFINEVMANTKKVADFLTGKDIHSIVLPTLTDVDVLKLVGVEEQKMVMMQKYGRKLYERADKEVPFKENGERDFTKGNLKLAYLKRNSGEVSQLVDLSYLCDILASNGVSVNINFDSNEFYYQRNVDKAVSRT